MMSAIIIYKFDLDPVSADMRDRDPFTYRKQVMS